MPSPRPQASLVETLRGLLAAHADPARAPAMQAYMKSALPFHGIGAPLRRRLMAQAVREHPMPDAASLQCAMATLWREARFREERYAAMELARVGTHRRLLGPELLPLYEEMITSSAWWDCCDDISGSALAALLRGWPERVKPVLRRWAHGDDLWLRRAAMLCQRRMKPGEVDSALLYEAIEASLDEPRFNREFFVCKAMGWALRDRSYHAPVEVSAWLRAHEHEVTPLTRREALKATQRRAPPRQPG